MWRTINAHSCRIISFEILMVSIVIAAPLAAGPRYTQQAIGREERAKQISWDACLHQKKEWYASDEAIRIAENVLAYQRDNGGWPKDIDMARALTPRAKERLARNPAHPSATIDNGATFTQMRYLAKVFTSTGNERFAGSLRRGLDYLFAAQYANGGWPQFYPLIPGYYTRITFNDDAMIGVMNLLQDIVDRKADFAFVDEARRAKARQAVERGIECILKCQVRVKGTLTVWCAQHDEHDFSPSPARTYELASLSGAESVGIVKFLMRFDNPSPAVVTSVQSAIRWFDRSRLSGLRVVQVPDPTAPEGTDKVVVKDPNAPSLWARFYEIETNRPFFSGRDGIPRYDLSEITSERRNNYGWLGDWPAQVLRRDYPRWQKRWAPTDNVLISK